MIYYDSFLFIYCTLMRCAVGRIAGSFLNCCAYRTGEGISFAKGKSHCTTCGHELHAIDLIPVFSWLMTRGRCRYCGEKVSVRYPLTELFMAFVTLCCVLKFDISVKTICVFIFMCCLFTLSLIDMETFEIPDSMHIVSAAAWLVSVMSVPDAKTEIKNGLISRAVVLVATLGISLIMDRVLKKESLGGGDIKLFAVCALWLGGVGILFCVMLSCFMGLLITFVTKNEKIPFGPSISLSCFMVLIFGEPVINRYLNLL